MTCVLTTHVLTKMSVVMAMTPANTLACYSKRKVSADMISHEEQ